MDRDAQADLIRRSFNAYKTAVRADMEAILADDFTFTSPYDDHIDRAAYFERCWPLAGTFVSHDLIEIAAGEGGSFVLYNGKAKSGATFRNVEFFTFKGGKIASVEVFFGLPLGAKPQNPPQQPLKS
jgi:ketosteroid isomerase-like protein